MRHMSVLLGSTFLLSLGGVSGAFGQTSGINIDSNDIGGVVRSGQGPEAGVWVIAETYDLDTRHVKIVVTDDQGRYVIPDLPEASYQVWVRGYGLVDSDPVDATPGNMIDLTAVTAPTPQAAAEYYPATYWFSLVHNPGKDEFPGTGPSGNGIAPGMQTQQDWIGHLKEQCHFCHQMGTKATRELLASGDPIEAWDMRVQMGRSPDDPYHAENPEYTLLGPRFGITMNNNMTRFGRQRGLAMFADWTNRIAAGEVPPTPERPKGLERNIVISLWDAGDLFLHDSNSSDKRDPTVNANGPVYAVQQLSGQVVELDPNAHAVREHKLVGLSDTWNPNMNNHTSIIDAKGRYWMSNTGAVEGDDHPFCSDGSLSPYAAYYPYPSPRGGRFITVFDPETETNEAIPVCFGSHHLHFTKDDVLFYTGDTQVVGWIDTKIWDETKDPAKSIGWCPTVLDTSGDGRIDPNRENWNQPDGLHVQMGDPSKDTRIAGFHYAMGISPVDQSYWVAKYSPTVPSGIMRVELGSNPPETCKTEYYEAPLVDGEYLAYNARGADVDADGIVWVAYGTGKIGRFDRSKCEVLNGPTAIGQQCPEGWTVYDTPGPKMAGTNVGTDYFYQAWVDHHNVSGLGQGTPMFSNSAGDGLLAFLPDEEEFVRFTLPYPMGWYTRGHDGRIDDPKTGWKGRGLWATQNTLLPWHQETGEGSQVNFVKFQLRPHPLAN
jgi:hypothetical protein